METKTCTICLLEKPLNQFYLSKGKYYSSYCKKCSAEDSKKRRANKPYVDQRPKNLQNRYGITVEEANELLDTGKCEGCGRTDRKLFLDHLHGSKGVRGVLCHNCNAAFGLLGESSADILGLLAYQQKLRERGLTKNA